MEVSVFVDWTSAGRGEALVVGGRQAEPHAEIGSSGALVLILSILIEERRVSCTELCEFHAESRQHGG